MVRQVVQLTESQAQRLRDRARHEGVPISELVRQGVEVVLNQTETDAEMRRRAIAVAGYIHDPEAPNLSEHHDDYLVQVWGQ